MPSSSNISQLVLIGLLLDFGGFCAFADTTVQATSSRNKTTNVVLIVADNQSPSLLGAYGNPAITTPNIDRLAAEGMVFTNAYAASGVCSPTRAALLSGLIPSQTGVHNALPSDSERIGIEDWSAIEEFRTLPQTLSAAGYTTALIGKYHLGQHARPQIGFDHWVTMTTGHTKSFLNTTVIDNGETLIVNDHITDFWTQKAVEFIDNQDSEQPFFLMLSYNGPYMLPPVVTGPSQSRFADHYRLKTPKFPQEPVHEFLRGWAIGGPTSEHMRAEATHAWAAIAALNNKQAMINTAAETAMVDAGVGRVLAAIKANGFDDNTLLIYTSDQGSAYGHHGLWGNTSWAFPFPAYDAHLRIPLIIRHTGAVPPKRASALLVNQVDLFPTILDHVGMDQVVIENTSGRSIHPVLIDAGDLDDTAIYFEFITVRGVRTTDWKFVRRFPSGPNELYFIRDDPDERNNLIDDPRYDEVRQQHSAMLEAHFSRYANPLYDLWNGGTAKGRLLGDYGENRIFADRFPGWRAPFIRKARAYEVE